MYAGEGQERRVGCGSTSLEQVVDHPAEGLEGIGVPAIEVVSPWCDDEGNTPPECPDEADDIIFRTRVR